MPNILRHLSDGVAAARRRSISAPAICLRCRTGVPTRLAEGSSHLRRVYSCVTRSRGRREGVTVPEWNEAHLERLLQGSQVWNSWRRANRHVRPEFEDARLQRAQLDQCDLSWASLINAYMDGVSLNEASLSYSQLNAARMPMGSLRGARCYGTSFLWVKLNQASLRAATLQNADCFGTVLTGADLRETDLRQASFRWATLEGADLSGALLDRTSFDAVDLRRVLGLEDVIHRGPSTIGLDSLIMSQGAIPEAFLRGTGASDTLIAYAQSLAVTPIQFCTCFISHSSADNRLARRLYADLQAAGVRCWFAPEDLRIGERFRQEIDDAIRLYDKLLVILSCNSLESSWVETEVESAQEKERQTRKTVLFPIRTDDAVMESPRAWAADIRRTRHVGDFRGWESTAAYETALDRLLRDLKADS